MHRRAALILPLLLLGCDQMRPEPVAELPPGLVGGAGDPLRYATETAAHSFLDRETTLIGGAPAEAAFAAAMVENASTGFQHGRYADPWITRLLREGRTALRGTLGLDLARPPQEVQDALLAAAAAFRRGDTQAATAALAVVATRNANPAPAFTSLETPQPLRRALREARNALLRRDV